MMRKILLTLGVFCLLLFILLPALISTSWGTKWSVAAFNSLSSGKLSIEKMRLNWIGRQHIEKIHYQDNKGKTLLDITDLQTDTSLLYLLFGGRQFGATLIENPHLLIFPLDKEGKGREKCMPTFSVLTLHHGKIQIGGIILSDIEVEKKEELLHLKAKTEGDGTQGEIEILYSPTELKGRVNHFPLALLDQLDHSTFYTDAIGHNLNLTFQRENQTWSAVIESKNLNGTLNGTIESETISLNPSGKLTLNLTPKLLNSLLPESEKRGWQLASPATITLDVMKGIFPLNINKLNYNNIKFQATGTLERAELKHNRLGNYSLNNFHLEVAFLNNLNITYKGEIQGKESAQLRGEISRTPEGALLFQAHTKGFPVSLLAIFSPTLEEVVQNQIGPFFDLATEGTYQKGKLEANYLLTSQTIRMEGKVEGALSNLNFDLGGNRLVMGKAAPYIGNSVEFQFNGKAHLSQEGISILRLNGTLLSPYYRAVIQGKGANLHSIELTAKGEIIELPFKEEYPEITFQKGEFAITACGRSNRILGTGSIKTQGHTSEIRFEITDFIQNDHLDIKKANISFNCALNHLPVALLDPLLPGEWDLKTLLGKAVTIHAKGNYTPSQAERGTIELVAQGEGLEASISLVIDETLNIGPNRETFIHWTLTPERYRSLITSLSPSHTPIFQLTKPARLSLSIQELTCPVKPLEGFSKFLCQTGLIGDLKVGTLTFMSYQTQEYLVIKEMHGKIEGVNFSEAISLYFGGKLFAQNIPHSEEASFEFTGKMIDFWTSEGKLNRSGLALDGNLKLDLLPVRQVTEIFAIDSETKELLQAILGDLVNARLEGRISQLTGPLTVDIKSSNFKATLPLMVQPHMIHLRDHVTAEITLTDAVNKTLIRDINPLLIAGAYSDHPIKVHLSPEGFMIPIAPYSLQGVQIAKGVIDIGRIRIRNGGQIQLLMDFLKAKEITPEGEMEAWFTPIYFNLRDGVASYNRFDALLAQTAHIAMWGSINLINNKVRMVLGIDATTLQKRFNISVKPNEMFQIKMRGTTEKLDLDWSAASTRIGYLVAKTSTGPIGQIVGGILEQIVTALGEEPTPPPTTSPFPWEK